MSSAEKTFQDALGALNARKYQDAERLFRKFLKGQPGHVGALNLLTIVLMRMERFAEAEGFIAKAVKLNQSSDVSFYNYGIILKALDRPQAALEQFSHAVRLNAGVAESWNNRGTTYNDLQQYEKAIADFDQAIALSPGYSEAVANKGKSLGELKRHEEALAAYDRALSLKPDLAEAWLGRGKVLVDLKRYDEAFAGYDRALSFKPDLIEAWLGSGNVFADLRRYGEALAAYDRAVALKPGLAEGWLGRGNALAGLRRTDEAFAAYDKALSFEPGLAEAWVNRGNVLADLGRRDEALAAHGEALSIKPDLAGAWLGRGNAFFELKRVDDAAAAYDEALSRKPDLAGAWLGRGNVLAELKRFDEAFAAYDSALSLNPDLPAAWLGRGNAFCGLQRYEDAFAAYDKALSFNPDLAEAWLGRGNAFARLKHYDEAFAAFDKALSLKPDLAEAWFLRGNALADLARYGEAAMAYSHALKLFPDMVGVEGARLHCRMQLCDWADFATECDHLVQSVRNGKENTTPFAFLGIASSLADQLDCARIWTRAQYPLAARPVWRGEAYEHGKIRIGYVSADFRQHPVADLLAGVFEAHDRSRFEVLGMAIGLNDNSEMRRRLERSFDSFIDAAGLDDDELAKRIGAQEIDILIDLSGFTQNARTGIFARRPAPIQVNYLGYAGTMGADYIDYIVADPVLIPASHRDGYAEKIVCLPHSFMPHDDKSRRISDRVMQRAEFGLPADGFVFCCFNNAYKLNPALFQARMKLLQAVEGSVLWLSENNPTSINNLRAEAAAADVDPGRLVFAGRMPSAADHLARHRLADLFLDTLPYNAHATASDALWAGLPVLTQIGETFAGRVAASLLTAVGLPELIARTPEQFEGIAIELATKPAALAAIRSRLAHHRITQPLFDTALYTRHIESAYVAMYRRHRAGLLPDHIDVPE